MRGYFAKNLGSILLCMVLFGGAGCFGFPKMPAEPTPGVVTGVDMFSKARWVDDLRLGKVSTIVALPQATEAKRYAVAGSSGVVYLDPDGHVGEIVSLNEAAFGISLGDVRPDGFGAILTQSGPMSHSVLDATGKKLFDVGGFPGIDSLVACDIDNDGKLDFVAGYNAWGGVRRFDATGKELWKADGGGNVWHVDFVDDGHRGKAIIQSNAAGQLMLRDGAGVTTKTIAAPTYCSFFALSPWPKGTDKACVVDAQDDHIYVFATDGSSLATYDAPAAGVAFRVAGTPVKFRPDSAPYFAALVKHIKTATLYIYDEAKKLVYQENLSDATEGLVAIENGNDQQDLIVGAMNGLNRYTLSKIPGPATSSADTT